MTCPTNNCPHHSERPFRRTAALIVLSLLYGFSVGNKHLHAAETKAVSKKNRGEENRERHTKKRKMAETCKS